MSRRRMSVGGFACVLGLILAGCGVLTNELYDDILAQEAERAAALAEANAANPSFLFTLSAADGTLMAVPDSEASFTLTLHGLVGNVISFSDRPQRIADHEALADFVAAWESRGFIADPPNAALLLHEEDAHQDVVVVTLAAPIYDTDADTLTFAATVLRDAQTGALAEYARRADETLPQTFGACPLLIDDAAVGCAIKILIPPIPLNPIVAHAFVTRAGSSQTQSIRASGGTLDLGTGVVSFTIHLAMGLGGDVLVAVTCPDDGKQYTLTALDFIDQSLPDGFTIKPVGQ